MKQTEVIPMPHLLAKNLSRLRKEKTWTQKKVADFLGIKIRTYQAMEECRVESPPLMILFKIKDLYRLKTIEQLFY